MPPDAGLEELIAAGIRGAAYSEIPNPRQRPIVLNKIIDKDIDIDVYFQISFPRRPFSFEKGSDFYLKSPLQHPYIMSYYLQYLLPRAPSQHGGPFVYRSRSKDIEACFVAPGEVFSSAVLRSKFL